MPDPLADTAVEAPRSGEAMNRNIGHLLRRAYARARKNTAVALEGVADLSPVQAAALMALKAAPLTQAELGRRIEMEPANIHGLVRRLAAIGLIRLQVGANQRRPLVAITTEGRAVCDRLDAVVAASAAATLARLDDEERATLIVLLQRIVFDRDE